MQNLTSESSFPPKKTADYLFFLQKSKKKFFGLLTFLIAYIANKKKNFKNILEKKIPTKTKIFHFSEP